MALGGGGHTHHLFPRSCPLSQVREAPETPTFHFSYTSAGVQTCPGVPTLGTGFLVICSQRASPDHKCTCEDTAS